MSTVFDVFIDADNFRRVCNELTDDELTAKLQKAELTERLIRKIINEESIPIESANKIRRAFNDDERLAFEVDRNGRHTQNFIKILENAGAWRQKNESVH